MTENEKKIGNKYTRKLSNDNNIYRIEELIEKEGVEYFKLGPYLQENPNTKEWEKIDCSCNEIDDIFLEQPNL